MTSPQHMCMDINKDTCLRTRTCSGHSRVHGHEQGHGHWDVSTDTYMVTDTCLQTQTHRRYTNAITDTDTEADKNLWTWTRTWTWTRFHGLRRFCHQWVAGAQKCGNGYRNFLSSCAIARYVAAPVWRQLYLFPVFLDSSGSSIDATDLYDLENMRKVVEIMFLMT